MAGVTMTLFSNYDSLFVRTVAFPVQVAYWIKEVIAPCGTSVPCQLRPVIRRHGRGVLWTGGDPCMTGCLECPLASPVFAQSWSQTATDQGRIYYEASASGPHHLGGPHQNFNAVSKVDFFIA